MKLKEKNEPAALDEPQAEDEPLPFLQRPLGVPEPPTTKPRTWEDTKADMLDQSKRIEARRHMYVSARFNCEQLNARGLTKLQASRRRRRATLPTSTL